jgi:CRP-like cAMP-binding protein
MPSGRFSEFVTLTTGEREAVYALATETLCHQRRSTLRREGAAVQYLYFLTEGWVASSMVLKDGGRQFFKVHIPGDVLGAPSLASVSAVETLTAITDCTIQCVPLSRLGSIFAEHPRVGMSLFLSANKERVALMDMLAAVGRMSAIGRLARFLTDLHERLLAAGQTKGSRLPMPMIQEEIADLLGLTAVHVNRMLHELESLSLLRRTGTDFILDVPGLQAMNLIALRAYVQEPSWLPSARG